MKPFNHGVTQSYPELHGVVNGVKNSVTPF
jgi:hypothetical protein